MAKKEEQESNIISLDPAELSKQAEEEGALNWEEEPLTPEEVLATFHIIARTMQEIAEEADWAPWHYWTQEQAEKLADYVNSINWEMGTVKTVLQLCGIEVDE